MDIKRIWLPLAIISLFVCFIASNLYAAPSNVSTRYVNVTRVIDGDTVEVTNVDGHTTRVRLACIDAPEKKQPFGSRAKQALSGLVFGKDIKIVTQGTDRYGRTIATLLMPDSTNVNLAMVRYGFAWTYRRYCHEPQYYVAESEAKAARRGLWTDSNPIEPWLWRAARRHSVGRNR